MTIREDRYDICNWCARPVGTQHKPDCKYSRVGLAGNTVTKKHCYQPKGTANVQVQQDR